MLLFKLRQGIGLDIEYNEDICHLVADPETDDIRLIMFAGILIKIPFFTIYFGDFFEGDD